MIYCSLGYVERGTGDLFIVDDFGQLTPVGYEGAAVYHPTKEDWYA